MSLKAELETWAAALKAYDEENFDLSLDLFSQIMESSKIRTNMGLIYATLGEHEQAVQQFMAATELDQYLAIAYFQCGVSNFLLGQYEVALKDFEDALLYLRGNQAINYDQLGLKYRLYSAEVLFNKGLCFIYMGDIEPGLADMEDARQNKATDEHNVIDDAIKDKGEGYTVFSIPVGVVYRPPENKIKNAKAKDYLGKAKLVAAADASDAYTTFTGVTRLRQGITPTGAPLLDRPPSDPSPAPLNSLGGAGGNTPMRSRSANATLGRSPTTINVVSRPSGGGTDGTTNGATGVGRSMTMRNPGANGGMPAGPARGLSIKKINNPSGGRQITSPLDDRGPPLPSKPSNAGGNGSPTKAGNQSRLTEFYDDYIDGYGNGNGGGGDNVEPLPEDSKRVAAWAAKTSGPGPGVNRSMSSRAPSMYSGGGSVRRRTTRRLTYATSVRGGGRGGGGGSGGMSVYDEDEEGYGSGEYDDGPWEMTKIKVKIHYNDDVRGMALEVETTFDEFLSRLAAKFNKLSMTPNPSVQGLGIGMNLKFKDEDGTQVSLRDESDFELAVETAREHAKGKPEGKLEVWADDV